LFDKLKSINLIVEKQLQTKIFMDYVCFSNFRLYFLVVLTLVWNIIYRKWKRETSSLSLPLSLEYEWFWMINAVGVASLDVGEIAEMITNKCNYYETRSSH
jgi:hypothetical protein